MTSQQRHFTKHQLINETLHMWTLQVRSILQDTLNTTLIFRHPQTFIFKNLYFKQSLCDDIRQVKMFVVFGFMSIETP